MGGRRRRGFYGLGADGEKGEKEKFACLWKFSNALEELSRVAYEGGCLICSNQQGGLNLRGGGREGAQGGASRTPGTCFGGRPGLFHAQVGNLIYEGEVTAAPSLQTP